MKTTVLLEGSDQFKWLVRSLFSPGRTKNIWMQHLKTWFNGKHDCGGSRLMLYLMTLEVFSTLMILWFYDSMILWFHDSLFREPLVRTELTRKRAESGCRNVYVFITDAKFLSEVIRRWSRIKPPSEVPGNLEERRGQCAMQDSTET